jgi:ribonuclease Z
MGFSVTVIGSSSATPTKLRNPSAQLLNHDECFYLIDCGEGTQMRLKALGLSFRKIENIFISHLHGDHYLGLPGLLFSMHLFGRTKQLDLFGPPQLKKILDEIFKASESILLYKLVFHPLTANITDTIINNKKITIKSFPLLHRLPTWGFKFEEAEKERKIKKDFILNNDVSIEQIKKIKKGEDFIDEKGGVILNSKITKPSIKGRTYAYCSDTAYYEKIIPEISNVDLLYHEATFMSAMQKNANEKYHSTSVDAANIAKLANVRNLLLGHFSARYKDVTPLLNEAKTIFPNTFIAEDNNTYIIEQNGKIKIKS